MTKTDLLLTDFKCLSFDCYGTLVDWEGGIYKALAPLYEQLPDEHPLRNDRLTLLRSFITTEGLVQTENPTALYRQILSESYGRLADDLGVRASDEDKKRFSLGVGNWPIYPDTLEALKKLQRKFKLVILSNVDNDNFEQTLKRQFQGIKFDAIYTAENIGSYKPSAHNFEYLIAQCQADLGITADKIIHVAQALPHDHVPATAAGLTTAWIERGEDVPSAMGGKLDDFKGSVSFSWRFKNLGEMAEVAALSEKN